jgi:hypothetical protein
MTNSIFLEKHNFINEQKMYSSSTRFTKTLQQKQFMQQCCSSHQIFAAWLIYSSHPLLSIHSLAHLILLVLTTIHQSYICTKTIACSCPSSQQWQNSAASSPANRLNSLILFTASWFMNIPLWQKKKKWAV